MLPQFRTEPDPYQIPKLEINKEDFDGFLEELKAFHGHFHECFSRKEVRENFFEYMVGQFSPLERKSIEPIALAVSSRSVRAMQRTVSELSWDEDKMLTTYHQLFAEDLGQADGVLIFDESGFVKKGKESAGVARQYCGAAGKVENCQVGVFAAYASRKGYGLLDARLYLPKKWLTSEYRQRRAKCQIPEQLKFKTKPQLAEEIFLELVNQDRIAFRYIVADTAYGDNPDFIETLEQAYGKTYFLAVSKDTLFWLRRPETQVRTYSYRGKVHTKTVVKPAEKSPMTVAQFAEQLNDFFWYRRKVSEGSQGPIVYEFTRRKIFLARQGLAWLPVFLIIRRTLGDNPEYSYFISNAPESTRLKTFVWLSGIRWAVEQCFEETKTELGMDHYEVRKLPAWKHHIMTSMLAHFFLWHLMIRLGKKISRYYIAPITETFANCFAGQEVR
jgi:SRSO17 transposase